MGDQVTIGEARAFVGSEVALSWHDRKGDELTAIAQIYSADFVPLYGPCLVTDVGDIRLDRIVSCVVTPQPKIA